MVHLSGEIIVRTSKKNINVGWLNVYHQTEAIKYNFAFITEQKLMLQSAIIWQFRISNYPNKENSFSKCQTSYSAILSIVKNFIESKRKQFPIRGCQVASWRPRGHGLLVHQEAVQRRSLKAFINLVYTSASVEAAKGRLSVFIFPIKFLVCANFSK